VVTPGQVTILGLNYAPEPTGNAPYTTGLAEHLGQTGFNVTALVGYPHYPQWHRYDGYSGWQSTSTSSGVRLVRLQHWIPRPPRGARRLASEMSFGLRLLFARWHRPEIVLLVSPALFATWLAMIRLLIQRAPRRIVWVQDLYSQGMEETGEGGKLAVGLVRLVERWTLRRAHAVVAIHDTMAAKMVKSLGVSEDAILVIPNWSHITPSPLSPREAQDTLGWAHDFTVLHAGNMGVKQGLQVIVEAAKLASEQSLTTRFVLLGDGGERERLEHLAMGTDNLIFLDPLDETRFPIALAAADLLVVTEAPGVAEMAAPSKLTSYFAAGRPVVASVSPAGIVATSMAASGAGPVVESGNAAALLSAIERLKLAGDDRDRAGAHAHEHWQRELGSEPALAAWVGVIESTIRGEAKRGHLQ